MDTRNWIIAAIAALVIVLAAISFWPAGEVQEEPAAEEPAEPEPAD
ncbi:hypothetical protein [Chelativorans alearense]|nr:hypothetical protein [Chelativorans alearense]